MTRSDRSPGTNGSIATLLIYRPGALGDSLVALPAVLALRERYPDLRTVYACSTSAVELLSNVGIADLVISADDSRLLPLFGRDTSALRDHLGHIVWAVLWGGSALESMANYLRTS